MAGAGDSPGEQAGSAPRPLVDSPLEGLLEWDDPFRQNFVAGSDWAPWLGTAKYPPPTPPLATAEPRAKPPPLPPADADAAAYQRYRRDYEERLDAAYADWKRSVFVSLIEPWIVDRHAAEAARKLAQPIVPAEPAAARGPAPGPTPSG
jgi:hypothetical protein